MRHRAIVFVIAVGLIVSFAGSVFAAADYIPLPSTDFYFKGETKKNLEDGDIEKFVEVRKDDEGNVSGKGVALVIIDAPKEKIWNAIRDYKTYPQWMPNVEETKVSKVNGKSSVDFTLKVFAFTVKYTCIHKYDETAGTIRWRMDDTKPKENVDDSVGGWRLKSLGDNKTLVMYVADVDIGKSLPAFIQKWITNTSLRNVLKALRKRVE